MDSMELLQLGLHFDRHLESVIALYGTTVYLMLFAVVFCEIAFIPLFFLPGDPLLFICGALCATGVLKIWIVMPLLFTACVAASLVSYRIGRAVGQKLSRSNYRWLDRTALE